MPEDKFFQVGQKAFIDRDGRTLVVFFDGYNLDFPGGRIQEGEQDLTEALRREVREETSLEIEVGDPFTTWLSGRHGGVYLVGYRCRYLSGEVTLSEEHVDFRWVDSQSYRDLKDDSTPFAQLEKYFATAP